MNKRFCSIGRGFSLIELILVTLLLGVVLLSIGVVLVGNSRAWDKVYTKANAEVVTARQASVRTFARIIRQSARDYIQVAGDQSWAEAHYYGSFPADSPDRFALFTLNGNDALQVDFGSLNPRSVTDSRILCEHVSSCSFQRNGSAVAMTLEIEHDDGTDLVVISAVPHNE